MYSKIITTSLLQFFREIDPAFLRRFDKKLLIDLPMREIRIDLLKQLSSSHCLPLTEDQIESLASESEGLTGSEIKNAYKEFALKKMYESIENPQSKKLLSVDDLIEAIKIIPPSTVALVEKHRKWHHTNVNKTQTF